jgi:hypothetical protein
MILNIMLAHSRDKIKPAFSDPLLMLRWVVIEPIPGGFMRIPPPKKKRREGDPGKEIDGAGTFPEVPLFKGWLFGGRP